MMIAHRNFRVWQRKFCAIDAVFYLQENRKIKLEIKEDCLYHLIEVYTYGCENSVTVSASHMTWRGLHMFYVCCLWDTFSSKLKALHYSVPCGDSVLEMSLHLFLLHEILELSKLFKCHSPEKRGYQSKPVMRIDFWRDYPSFFFFFFYAEVIFFSVYIYASWEILELLMYGVL